MSRGGVGGGPELVELQATQWRLLWRTGDVREPTDIDGVRAAERPELGLGEPESTHRWTGTTCRAAPLACSNWSEERVI